MSLIRRRPPAPLAPYIEWLWWSNRETVQSDGESMLPSGAAHLVFALHDSPILCRVDAAGALQSWTHGVLHGPQTERYWAGPKPRGAAVGVSFKPAGAALLGVPALEVAGRHVTIEELWGARGRDLYGRVRTAASAGATLEVLERDMTARLARPLLLNPAVAHALRAAVPHNLPAVTEVQKASGYSARHFIALFKSSVGITPKQYFRLRRFGAVLRRLASAQRDPLADIAADLGYSDQAHLNREFREFAGITPGQYQPLSPDSVLHHRDRRPKP